MGMPKRDPIQVVLRLSRPRSLNHYHWYRPSKVVSYKGFSKRSFLTHFIFITDTALSRRFSYLSLPYLWLRDFSASFSGKK